ncbi:MAG: flagellar hook capping FlgD N-terminal domain-containing protein [Terriglobia bacterium]
MTTTPASGTSGVNPFASPQTTPSGAPTGLKPQQITMSDFMTLLSAQLQGQDPTQPVDPTTFVTQLAQFTQLDEVSQIYSLLQNYVQGTSTTAAAGTSSSGASGSGASGSQPAATS